MASSVASKGAPLASLLRKLLAEPSVGHYALRPAAVAVARRPYNTDGASLRRYDNGEEPGSESDREYEVSVADDRRRARDFGFPSFFSSDVLDPFGAPTSLGRLLSLVEDAAASATRTGSAAGGSPWQRPWWVAKVDDDAVHVKVPMPGLGKEHVKVWAEQNTLVIKGEGEKEPSEDNDAAVPRYSRRIDLAADVFRMDQIKAEMKNGVLKVAIPKVKEEERKDVFQVKVL